MKYNIGLALSGGGVKGFAHAGALKALEERGIIPDIIAGTSAGAVVAALYAGGNSP
ncbi:MAG: patatin-like phospholipase family protein, partial [Bacteroidales bacterium]|nr:patatin-like phospholipase family protein [Bacteroidales bacterium]MBP8678040.1 patatin-like phospholipase family protein [Bacteroidales bacterium]